MEFFLPVRVYYEDTDAGGVVYYANYLKYFERGRTEALRELGFEQNVLLEEEDIIFTVRSVNVDYLRPARFNDALIVLTRIKSVGKVSLLFEQAVSNELGNLAMASVRVACVRVPAMKPESIPAAIMQAIEAARAG